MQARSTADSSQESEEGIDLFLHLRQKKKKTKFKT
jgi:hypothetical protein